MKVKVRPDLHARISIRRYVTSSSIHPLIKITNGVFYRNHPSSGFVSTQSNPPLFSNLSFEIPSYSSEPEHWAILGPSSSGKTTFLRVLRSHLLCFPPLARSYPYLNSDEIERKDHGLRDPSRAIQYVGFGGEQEAALSSQATKGAYLSARYESRREIDDFSVINYLQGKTELNPIEEAEGKHTDQKSLERVIRDLRLSNLVDMPVSNLSNGQLRRAKIARALLGKPELLLLDEPFMGLDPPTLMALSPLLHGLAAANTPRLVLTLRPQDPIPDWITHLIFLQGNCEVAFTGRKEGFFKVLRGHGGNSKDFHIPAESIHEVGRELTSQGIIEPPLIRSDIKSLSIDSSLDLTDMQKGAEKQNTELGEPLVEMAGVRVSYGNKTVLGNWQQQVDGEFKNGLWWTIRRGDRWSIFGPNGSGKTTILSLICSDHPQTYALPILLFGRSRLPEPGQPGISVFDIQNRIGHSSPEIHSHMPRRLTVRQTLENAWAETFLGVAKLDAQANSTVDACLRWFEAELRPPVGGAAPTSTSTNRHQTIAGDKNNITSNDTSWADDLLFGALPFSSQRVALFLRAVIKKPDLVILDEAFSGMDEIVRDKCMLFLHYGLTKPSSTTTSTTSISSPNHIDETESDAGTSPTTRKTRHILSSTSSSSSPSPPSSSSKPNSTDIALVTGLEPRQALLCISHVREEVPACVREWICLPEGNDEQRRPARFGRLEGPIGRDRARWNDIWGM